MTQTNDQKNINAIKIQAQKLKVLVDGLAASSQENIATQEKLAELNKSILLLEETVQAFDSYRRQNNEMLQELQLQISSLNSTTSSQN